MFHVLPNPTECCRKNAFSYQGLKCLKREIAEVTAFESLLPSTGKTYDVLQQLFLGLDFLITHFLKID